MPAPTVSFPSVRNSDFTREVKASVDGYFRETGLARTGTRRTWLKVACMLTLFLGPYALIMGGVLTAPWMMWLACVVSGIGMAGVGFSVGHDALHGALSPSPRVNAFVGLSFELMGVSSTMWRTVHNVVHHTYTNVPGVDIDLEPSPFLRLSPHAPHKPWHRFQHWFAIPAYGLLSTVWILTTDFVNLGGARIAKWRGRNGSAAEWMRLLATKGIYLAWAMVLPFVLLPLPWWQVLMGLATVHVVGSVLLSVVFQLAHVVEGVEQLLPDETGTMEAPWMEHELRTTSNFAPGNALLGWYVGGLNFQIEHHLFPRVCSAHYPALSKLVQEAAARHGLPYRVKPTFRSALASHLRTLKQLSRKPVDAAIAMIAPVAVNGTGAAATPAIASSAS